MEKRCLVKFVLRNPEVEWLAARDSTAYRVYGNLGTYYNTVVPRYKHGLFCKDFLCFRRGILITKPFSSSFSNVLARC